MLPSLTQTQLLPSNPKSGRIDIALDASQIEAFETCPRKWYYMYVLDFLPLRSNKAFNIGSYYHEVLAYYYNMPLMTPPVLDLTDRLRGAIEFSASPTLLRSYGLNKIEDIKFHRRRLVDYFNYNVQEDETLQPIAVEQGFSHILYETDEYRYILEGRIDLVCHMKPTGLTVMDHKTQSRFDNRFELNHQVMNYLSFTQADYFIYNYIGLQATLPPEGIRRQIYKPHPNMLNQWKRDVIRTFDEMLAYITYRTINDGNELESGELSFPRRRAACDSSKYGLCPYFKKCSVPDNSEWVTVVDTAYKKKDKKWIAW